MEEENIEIIEKKKIVKNSRFYFDGKVELGHILTIIALILAFISVQQSKRELETKITDIKDLVERLDVAELERIKIEIKDLNNTSYSIRHTNDLWDHVLNANRHLRKIMNQQFYETSLLNSEITSILLDSELGDNNQRLNLETFLKINDSSIEINSIIENHAKLVNEYKELNEPKEVENADNEHLSDLASFNSSLVVFVDSLNIELNNRMSVIIEERKVLLSQLNIE